jgi:DNA-binding MurR/RpiR family transcriptional regulator
VDRIREIVVTRVNDLTPAEKRVARSLLADYPAAGLASASSLAQSAGTSTPTVLRFVARLGFGSFREFQQRLRDEVTRDVTSPVQRAARKRAEYAGATCFSAAVEQRLEVAEQLLRTVPPAEFDAAVRLLAGPPRRTLIAGGYFTRHLASLLASQLEQIVPSVDYTPEPLTRDITQYLDLRKDSVAVLFDFRRYEEAASSLAALIKRQGASLIVITDHELSPCAQFADVVLPAFVDGIPFDSDAGLLILIESLVECVFNAVGEAGIRRMARWEEAVRIPRAFTHRELEQHRRSP